jgi:hypothetical protein
MTQKEGPKTQVSPERFCEVLSELDDIVRFAGNPDEAEAGLVVGGQWGGEESSGDGNGGKWPAEAATSTMGGEGQQQGSVTLRRSNSLLELQHTQQLQQMTDYSSRFAENEHEQVFSNIVFF